MVKAVCRFGIVGLVVSLLSGAALSASAQDLGAVKPGETIFHFKDICIRSLFGISDEVLADTNRFPLVKRGLSFPIEMVEGVRFGDFTNAEVSISKNMGKPSLYSVRFDMTLGHEADDKALLREYEHAVDLVSKLLGVQVECRGLVDPNTIVARPVRSLCSERITARTILRLAKGQRVEIAATEASYIVRSGQPIQTDTPSVSVSFLCTPRGSLRSVGADAESVKELTLGLDYSELLSVKLRANRPQSSGGGMFFGAAGSLRERRMAKMRQREADEKATAEDQAKRDAESAAEKVRAEEEKAQREARQAAEAAEAAEAAKSGNSVAETNNTVKAEKFSVAEKLGTCDFLLNKDFKKNAKYYLCLFSASWCPPCRREMPRIAKTYIETLKDDPDIELIHFSRDQDDDKALAWAKEHDVKFPVVKPKGGNPLDLRCSGIPHLFILKADGTLVEHDHPMRIFNEEKFKELEAGAQTKREKLQVVKDDMGAKEGRELFDGYTWSYSILNGEASIESPGGEHDERAVSPRPEGSIVIPEKLGGFNVTRIRNGAFYSAGLEAVTLPPGLVEVGNTAFYLCPVTSLSLPQHVKRIGEWAFGHCSALSSVKLSPELTSIGSMAFYGCRNLAAIRIPSGVTSIGNEAFGGCRNLMSIEIDEDNRTFAAYEGVLYTKDLSELVVCPGGLGVVKVPSRMRSIQFGSLWWTDYLQQFVVDDSNANYRAVNGLLLTKDGSRVVAGINGRVVIPPSVSAIDAHAFHGYGGLTSVTIPPTVKSIGQDAFYGCHGLKKVVVGRGDVERIKGILCFGPHAPKAEEIQFEEADLPSAE